MLDLYYSETCPYCMKVLNYFNSKGIDFNLKDIHISENYDTLMRVGHIPQVPFLIDTSSGHAMYDSDSIISYVESKYA
ncbi:MAG: glutathione S-transferase N-terminal domain-containing protein [Candidatus Gastranaerophilaceae bacterium]|nr:glutathione S-transferase N-terminal domain-containing protein [Candidatus Gastranaerophilaceae bacterium]